MTTEQHSAAIYSELENALDLKELVELFVVEMPDRIAAMERALSNGDREALELAAHQLKGSAGSYGFHGLTPLAAAVEDALRAGESDQQVAHQLQQLLGACRLVRAGNRDSMKGR
jgi:HPt (histidine-containing phosphotransfer) domain-containing protein